MHIRGGQCYFWPLIAQTDIQTITFSLLSYFVTETWKQTLVKQTLMII